MKVAKLVYFSLATRVIVDDTASDDEIVKAARPQIIDQVNTSLGDNIEDIIDDEECPYNPNTDK